MKLLKSGKLKDGIVLGAGLTLGYIAVNGILKLVERYSGGAIPDEFISRVTYGDFASNYSDTLNTVRTEDVY